MTVDVIVALLMIRIPVYIFGKPFYDNALIEKKHYCYSDVFKIGAVKQ